MVSLHSVPHTPLSGATEHFLRYRTTAMTHRAPCMQGTKRKHILQRLEAKIGILSTSEYIFLDQTADREIATPLKSDLKLSSVSS
jgi:hypothetical protein